jgi:hypothetical protein
MEYQMGRLSLGTIKGAYEEQKRNSSFEMDFRARTYPTENSS